MIANKTGADWEKRAGSTEALLDARREIYMLSEMRERGECVL